MSNITRCIYAARIQRMSVLRSGGLPNIRRPTRNTFAATQSAPYAPAAPVPIDNHTCQAGGGVDDASRSSMAKLLTGGTKLTTTANVELGSPMMGIMKIQGTIMTNMS